MPVCRTSLALLLCAAVGWGASLKPLKGPDVKGEVKSISAKAIVITQGGKDVVTPVGEVLVLDLAPLEKVPSETEYTSVELVDGSVFLGTEFRIKGSQVELKQLGGDLRKLPLKVVTNVLFKANVEANRKEWAKRLAVKRRYDVLAREVEGVVNPVEGTFGEGSEDGTKIEFKLKSGAARAVKLAGVFGLHFQRETDPNAPAVACKVYDKNHNVLMASRAVSTATGLSITTSAGVKVEYAAGVVVKMDYSGGKIVYLSDLEPVKRDEHVPTNEPYRRDSKEGNQPLRIGGKSFDKGLWVHAYTVLEYDLKGEYREFKAVIGLDDDMEGRGATEVKIEADGKEIYARTFDRKDKVRLDEVIKNIKDVQRLRIIVGPSGIGAYGKHIDLGDVRVSK